MRKKILPISFFTVGLFFIAVVVLAAPSNGTVREYQKISDTEGNFNETLEDGDFFGRAVANIGDFDGDGVDDLVVGAPFDDDGGTERGAIYLLFMNTDGTVASSTKISDTEGNFSGQLEDVDRFGRSATNIGDLDGDGVDDLVIGSILDADGGNNAGAIYVLFMETDGTVATSSKISGTEGNFPGMLDAGDLFAVSVSALGDLNGDGFEDVVVGSDRDDDGGTDRGAAYMIFLNASGTVATSTKINSDTLPGELEDEDEFGVSVANIGDLDGDGVIDLAIGAVFDDDGGTDRGAMYIIFMNNDGTVKNYQKISDTEGNFTGTLEDNDQFGFNVAAIGDLDEDGAEDIVVSANTDDGNGTDRGTLYILFLNTDGTVKAHQEIGDGVGNFEGVLEDNDLFGFALAGIGDLDEDGINDIVVGADDDDGGTNRGAVYVLFLDTVAGLTVTESGGDTTVSEDGATDTIDLALDRQPTDSVELTVTPDVELSVSSTTLLFSTSTWDTPQTITVSAVDDGDIEGAHVGMLSFSASSTDSFYNALTPGDVPVDVIDNDSADDDDDDDDDDDSEDQGAEDTTTSGSIDSIPPEYLPGDSSESNTATTITDELRAALAQLADLLRNDLGDDFPQCPVFTQYNRITENSVSDEVQATKQLLTTLGFYSGTIDQTFTPDLQEALSTFQETFRETILDPWGLVQGTGYKYKTTNKFMNLLLGCYTGPVFLEGVGEFDY